MTAFLITVPEVLATAAGDLEQIKEAIKGASTAASTSTTQITAAASDEVSTAISQLFNNYGQEFQGGFQ